MNIACKPRHPKRPKILKVLSIYSGIVPRYVISGIVLLIFAGIKKINDCTTISKPLIVIYIQKPLLCA